VWQLSIRNAQEKAEKWGAVIKTAQKVISFVTPKDEKMMEEKMVEQNEIDRLIIRKTMELCKIFETRPKTTSPPISMVE